MVFKRKTLFAFMAAALLCVGTVNAQHKPITAMKNLYSEMSDTMTDKIIASLNSLMSSIDRGNPDTTLIDKDNYEFNFNFFAYLRGIENKDTVKYYYQGQLINLYPVARSQYSLMVAYFNADEIGRIFTFHAKEDGDRIVFASPIKYNTKAWKRSIIGTVTFHYPDTFNIDRAKQFDRKNVTMANKLKLSVRDWEMYMCSNYQEALQLQGCLYERRGNGLINKGDINDPKTLFSVMNDEDFSHDVLHIYASKLRENNRNAAECGLAYLWGNAYHANSEGKVQEHHELVPVLQRYVREHSEVKLLDLFEKNPDVLAEYGYPKPIYVKDIIAGLIWAEIEKHKGVEGVIAFLKCGRGYDNLFKSMDSLIGINRNNFDEKVRRLLFDEKYIQ